MTTEQIDAISRTLIYFSHFIGLLAASFFGAFVAFWFNNKLQKNKQLNLEKAKLSALIVNSVILSDRFLALKKDMIDFRLQEYLVLKKQLKKTEQILRVHPDGGFVVEIEKYCFEHLFKSYQVSDMSFDLDMRDYVFISAYNPHIYRLLLVTNRAINDANKQIKDFNIHIMELTKNVVHSYVELSILCSHTENFLQLINNALYFLELLSPLLNDINIKQFRFPLIEGFEFPDELQKYLPHKNEIYVKGFEHLEKMRDEIYGINNA